METGNQERERHAPDRNIEWTQATLRDGLRSQVSTTPLLNATTQRPSRAPKRFPLRALRQIPNSDERKLH